MILAERSKAYTSHDSQKRKRSDEAALSIINQDRVNELLAHAAEIEKGSIKVLTGLSQQEIRKKLFS